MIALDTNILVRIVAADDAKQTATARTLINSQTCFVPLTVALELEWVLRSLYASPRDKIASALELLLGLPSLHFERESDILSALDHYRAGFDFADALHHASAAGCDMFVTFDRDLIKRAKRRSLMPPIELA